MSLNLDSIHIKTSEIADRLGVSREVVKHLKKAGRVAWIKNSPSHGVQISIEELMKLMVHCAFDRLMTPETIDNLIKMNKEMRK